MQVPDCSFQERPWWEEVLGRALVAEVVSAQGFVPVEV
jgi:hypothetical protein